MSNTQTQQINAYLQEAEHIYTSIDKAIVEIVHGSLEDFELSAKQINRDLQSIEDIKIRNYLSVVHSELLFFSQKRDLAAIKSYYEEQYYEYCHARYNNTDADLQLLRSDTTPSGESTDSMGDERTSTTDLMFIEDILAKVQEAWNVDQTVKIITLKETQTSMAYYNYKEKAIYVNPSLTGEFKKYVLIHELMHHIHFSMFTTESYVSEFDFGAGYREGVAINLSERLIALYYPGLMHEHTKYLAYAKARGLISHDMYVQKMSMQEFTEHMKEQGISEEMARLQYISCLKFPGYKETYYPSYYNLMSIETSELIKVAYI